jgi:selenocysteine lyase/cysteine desulfurase
MPVAGRWAYFDHAAVAPLSGPAQAAIRDWAEDLAQHGDAHWKQWSNRVEEVRQLGARLVGADTEEVALVRNTTEGISLVAEGYPWQPGDNVVLPADEFPSNLFPWLNVASRGVEVRQVPSRDGQFDLKELDAACDARTRIVAVSWVGYATGWRCDVDAVVEIAHRHGALVCLDAIQGLGVFPLDVRRTPVDFLSADGHKWLLGPEGAGLFYIRREHLDRLRPLGIGWNSVAHAGDFSNLELKLKPSAARYEGGSYAMPGIIGLGASLELLAQFGPARIGERLISYTTEVCNRLSEIGAVIASDRRPQHASGIVSFELPGRDPQLLRRRCLERSIVLSCRAGRLRLSPHAYNNHEDLDRLIAGLVEAAF